MLVGTVFFLERSTIVLLIMEFPLSIKVLVPFLPGVILFISLPELQIRLPLMEIVLFIIKTDRTNQREKQEKTREQEKERESGKRMTKVECKALDGKSKRE